MKRDFEREFKELKLNEVPDLWNRIESGLSDKKMAASVSESAAAASNVYKLGKGSIWRRWGTIAAACLCVVLILPALSLVLGNLGGRKNNYSGSATNSADNAAAGIASSDMDGSSENIASNGMNGDAENMTDVSEMSEGTEATYESNMTMESETTQASDVLDIEESRNGLDSSDSVRNSPSEDLLNSADRSQEAANADISDTSASKAEKAMNDSADAADDSITNNHAYSSELEDGQVINGVVVEILESSVSGKDTVYKAVVKQRDEDGLLNRGQEISFICNSETEYDFAAAQSKKQALKEKERYEVSLRYEKNERVFVLLDANSKQQ